MNGEIEVAEIGSSQVCQSQVGKLFWEKGPVQYTGMFKQII